MKLDGQASTSPGIRAKLVRASLLLFAGVAITVLVGVALVQLELGRRQEHALEEQIRKTLITRGVSIARSHAFVFRTLVADNAVIDMHNTITRSVEQNDDVVYGTFLDVEGRAWVYCSAAAPCRPLRMNSEFSPYDTTKVLTALKLGPNAGKLTESARRETVVLGQPVLEFAEPVFVDDELAGVLRYGLTTRSLGEALSAAREAQASATWRALATFALGLLGVVALAVYFARRTADKITEPLSELTSAAKRIASGERQVSVHVASQDELQVLGETFNHMVSDLGQSYRSLETKNRELESEIEQRKRAQNERTELQAHLAQSQKMEAFGQLAGGVAHDFNNILAVVMGNSELASYFMEEEQVSNDLRDLNQDIRAAAARGASLTRQLLTFARREADNPRVVDVNETLHAFSKLIRRVLEESVALEIASGEVTSKVKIDPGRLEQVLMNLCVNARDAMPGGGKLILSTGEQYVSEPANTATGPLMPGHYVWIRAQDSGSGMTPEVRERIFEPFFTTKSAGQGTGLGLAMVHGIVQGAAGAVQVDSELGVGTTFTIYLPTALEAGSEARSSVKPGTSHANGSRVLLCEDEADVRLMTKRILERGGYDVTDVGSPNLAIEALRRDHFDLLLTDVVMPEINGQELADRARRIAPALPVLFVSGYTGGVLEIQGLGDDSLHFLRKPFEPSELLERVRLLIVQHRTLRPEPIH